ncbi:phosphoenolpyruvate--protein phosphotransferase [Saccharothrix variisporea]|uniref:Phosphoenolpyruvate-protein phosphotransferase n=1 Tax=Saccharothrix variisporea TaxID=543527 RepID=A0A495X6C3_9PSEU|nr:phosphoenolpyruvate--protein phosphotransferase [Saccharothrix variisporea]RKT69106.1 phosphoenolpyruvate--protein phosphotransferase [Saccharothrix variisporea]
MTRSEVSRELTGNPAGRGQAVGVVARLAAAPVLPAEVPAPGPADAEVAVAALGSVVADLRARAEGLSGVARDILDTQVAMAEDPALMAGVRDAVARGRPAAWALHDAFEVHVAALAALGGYLGERAGDLVDLRDRAIAAVLGVPSPGVPVRAEPFVLVSTDLAPADTVTLDPSKVVAIVTAKGGPTSHTAILARALGIPAVVGCAEAESLVDGDLVVVDGTRGVVVVSPDDSLVDQVSRAAVAVPALHHGPGSTSDGHPVRLLLNVGGPLDDVVDAEGVGLFRTEFLFLDRTEAPSREEQRRVYGEVFASFGGRPVVVRTLDAGADKPLPFANSDDEPNPALGVRGYRVARRRPELLADQLAAIADAAASHGTDVRVMAPMIATAAEAREFADLARSFGFSQVGVMIEIPAAALRADEVLAEVDFVSIGTNDLAQYTFAADRVLGDLGALLDPWQPALLDLIALVAEAGRRAGKPVGVCGEAAGDPALAPVLVGLGVTSLSMSAPALPHVRAALREHTLAECTALARRAH